VRLHIVARGKIGRGPEAALVDTYIKRIAWPLKISELGDAQPVPERERDTVRIILDERGENLTSRRFADRLQGWRDEGRREACFLIGPADGFGDDDRRHADLTMSFGRATWPHLLVRAMLAEQLWRATSIIAGHPYHREG